MAGAAAVALAAAAAAFGGNSSSDRAGLDGGSRRRPDMATIACGRTRTIGVAAPITGAAASLGQQQLKWARFFVTRYNRRIRGPSSDRAGDTQLPDTAQAIQVANGSRPTPRSSRSWPGRQPGGAGLVGAVPRRRARLRLRLGDAHDPHDRRHPSRPLLPGRSERRPAGTPCLQLHPDDPARDEGRDRGRQDAYSVGLSDTVERLLKAAGADVRRESVNPDTTTDFSSLAARESLRTRRSSTSRGSWLQGAALRAAAPCGRQDGNAVRLGRALRSRQLQDPRLYVSFFPIDLRSPVIAAYRRGPGSGESELFGLPTYVATDVVARAIEKACRNGQATRGEVRRFIGSTLIPKSQSLLGFQVRFVQRLKAPLGPGDMERPADFGIYRINASGAYVRVS